MPSPAAAAVDSTSVSNDVDKTGFRPIQGPSLFMDPETGHLINSEGERVDKLGRLTRARGAKGKFSSRGKHQPNVDRPAKGGLSRATSESSPATGANAIPLGTRADGDCRRPGSSSKCT